MEYRNILALQNVGNMCYLNSALQCLLSIREFRDFARSGVYSEETVSSISDLCDKYEDPSVPLANPIMVKKIFGKYDSFFRNNMQQDSHECLIRLIDIIHEAQVRNGTNALVKRRSDEPKGVKAEIRSLDKASQVAWEQYIKLFGRSFVTDIFGGQIKSILVCQICKVSRFSYETINNLSLPLTPLHEDRRFASKDTAEPYRRFASKDTAEPYNNIIDIVDCFRSFFSREHLEDMLTCDHCKTKTPTIKYMKLWIYPKVLILHLKRYDFNRKINNVIVETSENLVFRGEANANEVSNCVELTQPSRTKEVRYKLKCIVNHFGSSPNSGHYTCLSSFKNEWVNIDDSNIYKTANFVRTDPNSKHISTSSSSSYVLMYERI